jgi:hypothetical protein
MKYLCLVYVDEKMLENMSQAQSQALVDQSLDHDDALRRSGHLIAANALHPVRAATTLRARKGKILVTDGPFAETTEQVGGFVLIEAKDLEEAIQLASEIPPLRLGGIEIRAIQELTHSSELTRSSNANSD